MDDRITAILARLRGGVAGIYAQKKLDELDEDNNTQDWDEFVKEIKTMFSDKSKAADAEWKIETFKQEKRNTADFIIEFEALAMKADTDELHTIFLLKKNVQNDTGIPTYSNVRDTQGVESGNYLCGTRIRVHRRTTRLQDKHWNNIWRKETTNGHWEVQQQL